MTRKFQCVVLALVVAFCFGQLALAAGVPHNWSAKVVPNAQAQGARPAAAQAAIFFNEYAAFVGTPWTAYVTPYNGDFSDLWPCFGGGTAANPDCPTIGSPSQPFATNGVVVGAPAYTWPLSFCNATASTSNYCGQTETWYEDDSLNGTADLTYLLTATQTTTTNFLVDSGTVDFGPNFTGGGPYASVIIYGDQNLGTYGDPTGPNNGNCSASYQYPIPGYVSPTGTPTGIAYPIVVAAGKTCHAPVASSTGGVVNFTATTSLGTPKYTKLTTGLDGYGNPCTVAAPCAKIAWTALSPVVKLIQKWSIWLQ